MVLVKVECRVVCWYPIVESSLLRKQYEGMK